MANYALVNTMSAVESAEIIGRIVSQHRTPEAAEAACAKLQRETKRFPGDTSYVPTRIVKLRRAFDGQALVGRDDIEPEPSEFDGM